MDPAKFKRWAFKNAVDTAKELLAKQGYLDTMFLGYTADGVIGVPGTFRNDQEKFKFLDVVRLVFAYYGVTYYVVVCEAWMGEAVQNDNVPQLNFPRPSEDPKRIEAVMCLCVARDGVINKFFKMHRDPDGKYSGLEELDFTADGASGDFTMLLPPKGKMPEHLKPLIETVLKALNVKLEKIPLSEVYEDDLSSVKPQDCE